MQNRWSRCLLVMQVHSASKWMIGIVPLVNIGESSLRWLKKNWKVSLRHQLPSNAVFKVQNSLILISYRPQMSHPYILLKFWSEIQFHCLRLTLAYADFSCNTSMTSCSVVSINLNTVLFFCLKVYSSCLFSSVCWGHNSRSIREMESFKLKVEILT